MACLRILVILFFFSNFFFRNFFRSNSLTFNTLSIPLKALFCCLLFQLKIVLCARLFSSIFSSWSGKTYGFIFLGFGKVFLCFLVICPVWPGLCVFLLSTYLGFPKNQLAYWRIWFGFLRSYFRLSGPKFKNWVSCLCLPRRFTLVCMPLCIFIFDPSFLTNSIVDQRIWFGFIRSSFRLGAPKFECDTSCLCLLRKFALLCIRWEF